MAKDRYSAVWVSHTSISDFLECPRAYYLKHVWRHPKTGHKVQLMSPALALGSAVHNVLESLSVLPTDSRMSESLVGKLDHVWEKVSGKKGGFLTDELELRYKEQGKEMLRRVMKHPGPLERLAIKIKQDLPHYWLSEEENIILCGKVDWLEYLKDDDAVHIIDFKTGKTEEKEDSLQLPIYGLLVSHCQSRPVLKASYWYLRKDNSPVEQILPDFDKAQEDILKIAKDIKLARQLERFKCPKDSGCRSCIPMEAIVQGDAEFVGLNDFGQDIYILPQKKETSKEQSVIL